MIYLKGNLEWHNFLKKEDKDSFETLYKNNVKDLYSYGLNFGFEADDCMDAIHDVFLKIFSQKKQLTHISNFRYYLFSSFRNRLFDLHKYRKKTVSYDVRNYNFEVEVSVADDYEDKEESRLLKEKVERLVAQLTERQREALFLRYMQNMEYKDIAEIMQINTESVHKLVYRAFETIRKNNKDFNLPILTILTYYFFEYI